jgi:murein DD-endopeptidase MepM/ murein hydrolase activator NlpD
MLGVSSEVHSNCLLALTPTSSKISTIVKNISLSKPATVTRFRSKSALEKLLQIAIGTFVTSFGLASHNANAADMYGFPNYNGKIVYLELSNGVRVNLPLNRAINDYKVNSYSADNSDDWKWKVNDDGLGVSFTRINTNKAFTVFNLNPADLTPIVAWDYSHNRYSDWNPEPVGGGYHILHLRSKPSQCLNIPGSRSNVWVTTFSCNANDLDQRFKIIEVISDIITPGKITLPFKSGQTWHVCQGYKTPGFSHKNDYGLDLSIGRDFGTNACWAADGNVSRSANQPVIAPIGGTIRHVANVPNLYSDLVCLSIDNNRSLLLGHMDRKVANGTVVKQGDVLGYVSSAGSTTNGGFSHIHLEGRKSSNCAVGTSVPLTAANGFQLIGIGDLPDNGSSAHFRKSLTRP